MARNHRLPSTSQGIGKCDAGKRNLNQSGRQGGCRPALSLGAGSRARPGAPRLYGPRPVFSRAAVPVIPPPQHLETDAL